MVIGEGTRTLVLELEVLGSRVSSTTLGKPRNFSGPQFSHWSSVKWA